jgi:hypothetical protein
MNGMFITLYLVGVKLIISENLENDGSTGLPGSQAEVIGQDQPKHDRMQALVNEDS